MRLAIGFLLAILVNFALFTVMQKMIAEKDIGRQVIENIQVLDFVRVKHEDKIETKKRELPKKPPPPEEPPPPPELPAEQLDKPKAPTPKLDVPRIDVPLNIAGGPYLGDFANVPVAPTTSPTIAAPTIDNEVMPLVRVPPQYPHTASRRGIEGVVTVSFIITKDGQVRDPIVVSAKPENIFDSAALTAVLKWKFKPKYVDGQAVERQATQEITFKLAK